MEIESLFPRESRNRGTLLNSSNLWSSDDESVSSFLATISQSDDDDRTLKKDINCYISDYKLIEKILEILPLDTILSCRLVCKKWGDVIGHSKILWEKACMTLTPRLLGVNNSLASLLKTDLVTNYKCPNFKFYCLELRNEIIRNFITIYGPTLKYLSFASCHMSKSTFDLILLECPNLTHLEVIDVPRSISMCRLLIPVQLKFKLNLTKLKILILKRFVIDESDEQVTPFKMKEKNQNQIQNSDNFNGENLSITFLEQFVESCTCLKKIELQDWEGATIYNLMTILNCREQFSTLTDLSFKDIRGDVLDSHHFFPLCIQAAGHLKLERLTVTLKHPICRDGEIQHRNTSRIDSNTDLDKFKDFDTIFELTLQNQRETLKYLNLTNVPVSGKIFKETFPNLTFLSLLSTWVDDIERLTLLMPCLQVIDYSCDNDYYGTKPTIIKHKSMSTWNFYQCSPLDFVCLTSHLAILGILTIVLLISLFSDYGEYFLGIGLTILIILCLSDISDSWHQYFTFW